MSNWQVVVGNIGTVYDGTNGYTAISEYNSYIGISKRGYGRAAGEPVTLFRDGEIYLEYEGEVDHDDN